jgi:hypothetical protein
MIPLHRPRRFVDRDEFVAMSRTAPAIDVAAFRADQVAVEDEIGREYPCSSVDQAAGTDHQNR